MALHTKTMSEHRKAKEWIGSKWFYKNVDTHEYRLAHGDYMQLCQMIADAAWEAEEIAVATGDWEQAGDSTLEVNRKEKLKQLIEARNKFEQDYIMPIIEDPLRYKRKI